MVPGTDEADISQVILITQNRTKYIHGANKQMEKLLI